MSGLLLEPVPHEEAMSFIKNKPVVSREVFKGLLPELKGRAFVVSGIEVADVVQGIRDKLVGLPEGGDWDSIKADIFEDMHPFLVSQEVTATDPKERAEQERKREQQIKGAEARAELLLRLHGFQAYSAAAYRELDEQRDIFTYWQYQTMGDAQVRHSHAVLNKTVLPHDSPFWKTHYPPSEWGCRCQVVGLMDEDVEDIRAEDAEKLPEQQRVFEGARRDKLEKEGKLDLGPDRVVDVRTDSQRGEGGFAWDPGELRLSPATVTERYGEDTAADFKAWALKQKLAELGQNVWEWMSNPAGKKAA